MRAPYRSGVKGVNAEFLADVLLLAQESLRNLSAISRIGRRPRTSAPDRPEEIRADLRNQLAERRAIRLHAVSVWGKTRKEAQR
jgi:hypothetical protein